VFLYGLP